MFDAYSKLPLCHNLKDGKVRSRDVLIADQLKFSTLLLQSEIQDGLSKCGFVYLSPIQQNALPLALTGSSIIAHAKSGTGKTLIYVLPVLNDFVKRKSTNLHSMVLAPTREIANQIYDVFRNVACFVKGIQIEFFIGGTPLDLDVIKCRTCHIAIGAPGRIKHLIDLGALKTDCLQMLVLDEVDALFHHKEFAISDIISILPPSKQLIVCTATFTSPIGNLVQSTASNIKYVSNEKLEIEQVSSTSNMLIGVKQYVATVKRDLSSGTIKKRDKLIEILRNFNFEQCFIFMNYLSSVKSICNLLTSHDFAASWLSSEQNQSARINTLNKLKMNHFKILVTTDLAARGIDVHNANLVINLGLPCPPDVYIHRMGRAGRYGSEGSVITILSEDELISLKKIISVISTDPVDLHLLPDVIDSNLSSLKIIQCLPVQGSFTEEEFTFKRNLQDNREVLSKNKKKNRQKKKKGSENVSLSILKNVINHPPTDYKAATAQRASRPILMEVLHQKMEGFTKSLQGHLNACETNVELESIRRLFELTDKNTVNYGDHVFLSNPPQALLTFALHVKQINKFLDEQIIPCSFEEFVALLKHNIHSLDCRSPTLSELMKDMCTKIEKLIKLSHNGSFIERAAAKSQSIDINTARQSEQAHNFNVSYRSSKTKNSERRSRSMICRKVTSTSPIPITRSVSLSDEFKALTDVVDKTRYSRSETRSTPLDRRPNKLFEQSFKSKNTISSGKHSELAIKIPIEEMKPSVSPSKQTLNSRDCVKNVKYSDSEECAKCSISDQLFDIMTNVSDKKLSSETDEQMPISLNFDSKNLSLADEFSIVMGGSRSMIVETTNISYKNSSPCGDKEKTITSPAAERIKSSNQISSQVNDLGNGKCSPGMTNKILERRSSIVRLSNDQSEKENNISDKEHSSSAVHEKRHIKSKNINSERVILSDQLFNTLINTDSNRCSQNLVNEKSSKRSTSHSPSYYPSTKEMKSQNTIDETIVTTILTCTSKNSRGQADQFSNCTFKNINEISPRNDAKDVSSKFSYLSNELLKLSNDDLSNEKSSPNVVSKDSCISNQIFNKFSDYSAKKVSQSVKIDKDFSEKSSQSDLAWRNRKCQSNMASPNGASLKRASSSFENTLTDLESEQGQFSGHTTETDTMKASNGNYSSSLPTYSPTNGGDENVVTAAKTNCSEPLSKRSNSLEGNYSSSKEKQIRTLVEKKAQAPSTEQLSDRRTHSDEVNSNLYSQNLTLTTVNSSKTNDPRISGIFPTGFNEYQRKKIDKSSQKLPEMASSNQLSANVNEILRDNSFQNIHENESNTVTISVRKLKPSKNRLSSDLRHVSKEAENSGLKTFAQTKLEETPINMSTEKEKFSLLDGRKFCIKADSNQTSDKKVFNRNRTVETNHNHVDRTNTYPISVPTSPIDSRLQPPSTNSEPTDDRRVFNSSEDELSVMLPPLRSYVNVQQERNIWRHHFAFVRQHVTSRCRSITNQRQ